MILKPASIGIIYDNSRSHLLLVKRKDAPIWVLPGGGIEDDETPIEAVKREVEEETGLIISIERQSAEYYPLNRLAALTHVFIGRVDRGTLKQSNECSAVGFFSLQDLPSNLFFLHNEWIQDALLNSTCLKKPLTQITYGAALRFAFINPITTFKYFWTRLTKK